jgi:small subunit ribosomal protein S4e
MSKHLKRQAAPRTWKVPRKTSTWVVRPSPGAHPLEMGISISYIVKDYLGYTDSTREARRVIGNRKVMVDNKPVREYKHIVGLMDVISFPDLKKHYRVLIDRNGKLALKEINAAEAKWKLVRIENKTRAKGGRIQLNLHDGRNILLDKNKYSTGDVLKIEVPSQKIMEHFEFKQGNIGLMIGGAHVGYVSHLKDFEETKSPMPNLVTLEDGYNTIKEYLFIIGKKKPEISVLEGKIDDEAE